MGGISIIGGGGGGGGGVAGTFDLGKTRFVSQAGSDSTGNGSIALPWATIGYALSQIDNSGWQILVARANLTENITINKLNVTISAMGVEDGSMVNIQGTVTVSHASSSVRLAGLAMTNLSHTGAGNLYLRGCRVNTATTLTGSGYVQFDDCDTQGSSLTGTVSINAIGSKVIRGGTVGAVTMNSTSSAQLAVSISEVVACAPITQLAGTLALGTGSFYAATETANALTVSGGITVLDGPTFLTPLRNLARVRINGISSYQILRATLDRVNSFLTGTKLSTYEVMTRGARVTYQANSTTFPANAASGDELIVTTTGASTGAITERWLYDGANWKQTQGKLPVSGAVIDNTITDPTTVTIPGRYIVPSSGNIGLFVGQANKYADYDGTSWVFTTPVMGQAAVIVSGLNAGTTWRFQSDQTWLLLPSAELGSVEDMLYPMGRRDSGAEYALSSSDVISNTSFAPWNSVFAFSDGQPFAPTSLTWTGGTTSLAAGAGNALSGNRSLRVDMPAGMTLGRGIILRGAVIDKEFRGKLVSLGMLYANSSNIVTAGNSTNSFGVYLVALGGGGARIVHPLSSPYAMAGQGTVASPREIRDLQFQIPSDATLGFVALVCLNPITAASTLWIDNVSVRKTPVTTGAVVTDWKTVSVSLSASGTAPTLGSSPTKNMARIRQVGGDVEFEWDYWSSGSGESAGSGFYYINLPVPIDSDRFGSTNSGQNGGSARIGTISITNGVDSTDLGFVEAISDTRAVVYFSPLGAANVGNWWGGGYLFPLGGATRLAFTVSCKYPARGYNSNLALSSNAPGGELSADLSIGSGVAVTNASIPFTASGSLAGSISGGVLTAPYTGWYMYVGNLQGSNTGHNVSLRRNGAHDGYILNPQAAVMIRNVTAAVYLRQGETSSLFIDGASTTFNNVRLKLLFIGQNQTIATDPSVTCQYRSTTTPTFGSGANITFNMREFDSLACYNTSTGEFTAPVNGVYEFDIQFFCNTAMTLAVHKNGVPFYNVGDAVAQSPGFRVKTNGYKMALNAGDKISLRSDAASLQITNAAYNYFSVKRVGNL